LRNRPASAGLFCIIIFSQINFLLLLKNLKRLSLFLLVVLYVGAGINHFIHPEFYSKIIPPYLPAHEVLVFLSGVAEIVLGVLLIPIRTRKWAALLIALMLIVFLPVHVYMLQQAYVIENYQTTVTMAWIRLLLQPVLIGWALWMRK
jgi:uncharacterized membrane protein